MITVLVENEILGNHEYCKVADNEIHKIGNLVARSLAIECLKTKQPQSKGMWRVLWTSA